MSAAPAGEPSQSQGQPSEDKEGSASGGHGGDSLPAEAKGLAGVSEPGPGTQLPTAVVAGKGLPTNDLARAALQRELRPQVWAPAISLIDGEGKRVLTRVGYPHADSRPSCNLLPGSSKKPFQTLGTSIFRCVFLALTRIAVGTDLSCRGIWWRRLVSRHPIKKIVRPSIGHDHAGDDDQEQGRGAPESQGVMPVPIPRATPWPAVQERDFLQISPAPFFWPPQDRGR